MLLAGVTRHRQDSELDEPGTKDIVGFRENTWPDEGRKRLGCHESDRPPTRCSSNSDGATKWWQRTEPKSASLATPRLIDVIRPDDDQAPRGASAVLS
jgi:hypothetical protein